MENFTFYQKSFKTYLQKQKHLEKHLQKWEICAHFKLLNLLSHYEN